MISIASLRVECPTRNTGSTGPPHEVYLECESKDKENKISAQRPLVENSPEPSAIFSDIDVPARCS